jgi:hypothetical protein
MASAVISDCGQFRYRLEREILTNLSSGPVYAFFGINPSTADASLDDATVRKWRGFVSRWGGSRFIVGNVFAFRATDVKMLSQVPDPIGRLNNDYLKAIVAEADILVPCWGNSSKVPRELRLHLRWLMNQLRGAGKPLMTFGLSKSGDPMHPLMLGYDTQLVSLSEPRASIGGGNG